MPSGIALGRPEPGRGGNCGESGGASERARPGRTPGRARTGAQDVGNAFAQRPVDFDDARFGERAVEEIRKLTGWKAPVIKVKAVRAGLEMPEEFGQMA